MHPQKLPTEHPKVVLVAFEEVFMRTIIRLALRRAGYEVHEAKSWEEVVRLWKAHAGRMAVAVLDGELASAAGRLELMRQENPLARILIAPWDSGTNRATARAARAKILPRPFDLARLVAAIEAAA